ncbi:unnamed protein product [Prorocentrum cordatum]|uniref:PARP n=1 Tax=Prorocentrum cordatum TaxID=2364126 RepID=A0ABN9RK90_9DINO|nr:unnamed protein product [Polarella glacialis]
MGEMGEKGKASKLDKLLCKNTSLIGQCSERLFASMEAWRQGGDRRDPWCVLDMMGIPVQSAAVMRFARNQTLRLAGGVFRRYETKYSSKPYDMHVLSLSTTTAEQKAPCIEHLLAADDDELDLYSRGIRKLFTKEELGSKECEPLLRSDFMTHAFSTDVIERLNSEITHGVPKRAPATNFTQAIERPLLLCDPPDAVECVMAQAATDSALVHPELAGSSAAAALPAGPGAAAQVSEDGVAVVPVGDQGGPIFPPCRTVSGCIDVLPHENPSTNSTGRFAPGLNPYLLEKNQWLRAVRALRDSPMTDEEVKQVTEEFHVFWENVADKDCHNEAYDEWVREKQQHHERERPYKYVQQWGGGSFVSPISSDEFCKHIKGSKGWPSDADVTDANHEEGLAKANYFVDFGPSKSTNLWSLGARPHNVNPMKVAGGRLKFTLVEKGISNVIARLNRTKVESGDVMLIVEGPGRASRISDKFKVVNAQTSDEFVRECCELFSAMELCEVEWGPIDVDGTLLWVEVKSATALGTLWKEGLRVPLGSAAAKRKDTSASTFKKMKTDDPLNPSSDTAKTSSSCAASTKAANGKVDPTSACGPIAAAVTGGPEGALGSDAAVAASLGAAGAADAGADEGFQLGALDGEFAVALDEMDVADQEDAEIHGGDDDMTELLDTWGGNQEDHHDERPDDGEIDLDDPILLMSGRLPRCMRTQLAALMSPVAAPTLELKMGLLPKMLLSLRSLGNNLGSQELFKWLFEGDPNNDGDSKDQRREKARIHMDSAKSSCTKHAAVLRCETASCTSYRIVLMAAAITTKEEHEQLERELFEDGSCEGSQQAASKPNGEGPSSFQVGLFEPDPARCAKCFDDFAGQSGLPRSPGGHGVHPSSTDHSTCQQCLDLKELVSEKLDGPPGTVEFPNDSDANQWPFLIHCYRVLRHGSADGTVTLHELAIEWAEIASKRYQEAGEIQVSALPEGGESCTRTDNPASESGGARDKPVDGSGSGTAGEIKHEEDALAQPQRVKQEFGFRRSGLSVAAPAVASAACETGASEGTCAAVGIDVDSEDDGDSDSLNKFSLTERLPKGQVYISFGRIRGTINQYVEALSHLGWLPDCRIQTVQALERRLNQHSSEISQQANVDIKTSFKQLSMRVETTIILFKLFKTWHDENNDASLVHVLDAVCKLKPFLRFQKKSVGADLEMILIYAQFYKDLANGMGIDEAINSLNFDRLTECHKIVTENAGKLTGAMTKTTDGAKVKDKDAADGTAEGEASPSKRRMQFTMPKDVIAKRVLVHPVEQFEKLVGDSMAKYIFTLSPDIVNDQKAVQHCHELMERTRQAWLTKHNGCLSNKVGQLLDAFATIALCAKSDESERPSVDSARWATKVGIEDEAASSGFEFSVGRFEDLLDPAFENATSWLKAGNGGKPMTCDAFGKYFEACMVMRVACTQALQRWSTSALEQHAETLASAGHANTVSNMYVLLHAGNFVYIDTVRGWIGHLLEQASQAGMADSCAAAGGDSSGPIQTEVVKAECESTQPGGDGNVQPTMPFSSPVRLFAHIREIDATVKAMRPRLRAFVELMLKSVLGAQKLCKLAATRVGGSWHDHFDKDASGDTVLRHFNHNVAVIDKIIIYLESLHLLADPDWWLDGESLSKSSTKPDEQTLCNFSRVHHEHTSVTPFTVLTSSTLDLPEVGDDIAALFAAFAEHVGQRTYDFKATAFLVDKSSTISDVEVLLGSVHADVLKECDDSALYPHLLPKGDADNVAKLAPIDVSGSKGDPKVLELLPHNRALEHLRCFIRAVMLTEIDVPGMFYSTVDAPEPSIDLCMFAMELKCAVADVVAVISSAEVAIGRKARSKDKQFMSQGYLCGTATFILQILHGARQKLDSMANDPRAMEFEKTGWQLRESIHTMRHWCLLAARVSGRYESMLLLGMAEVLTNEGQATAKVTPTWTACFVDDVFNETMAMAMLKNKLDVVINRHNSLHTCIKAFSTSAAVLSINPRVQDHPTTSESVNVALQLLKDAAEASVVIRGVDLLTAYRHRPEGPTKATKFLTENECRYPKVPQCFWQLFKDLQAHALPAQPLPAQAGEALAPGASASGGGAHLTPAKKSLADGSVHTPTPKKPPAPSSADGSQHVKAKAPSVSDRPAKGFKRAKRS